MPDASPHLQRLVGAVVLLGIAALLGSLLFFRSTLPRDGYAVHVDFAHVENLQPGADLKVAGKTVGWVTAIAHQHRDSGRPPIRVDVFIDPQRGPLLLTNSTIFVHSPTLLAKRYLEAAPPREAPGEPAAAGHVFRGADPAPTDRLLNVGHQTLRLLQDLAHAHGPELSQARVDLRRTIVGLGDLAQHTLWAECTSRLTTAHRELTALAQDLRQTGAAPTLRDVIQTRGAPFAALVARLATTRNRLSSLIDQATAEDLSLLNDRVRALAAALAQWTGRQQALAAQLQTQRGTLFRLAQDGDLYDQIRETHRLLTERPWRVLYPRRVP